MKSILPNLSQYKIVLGSNSPRRRELLAGLDIDFEVQTIPDIDESFPKTLRSDEVPVYIARKKAEAYISSMLSPLCCSYSSDFLSTVPCRQTNC